MVPSPGLVGGTGNESTQAVREKVAGEDAEVMSANTEDKSEDGQPLTKRRKVASGGRGVANMTPEQLAKKRANDREAQRAIRERTKSQIQALESRIEELTSQRPYQELQAVVRAKEAVERENADMKRRLASIIGMLQPMIGTVEGNGMSNQSQVARHGNRPTTSRPDSSGDSASVQASHSSKADTPNDNTQQAKFRQGTESDLNHQRDQLLHGLNMGPERLGLDFLLGTEQRVSTLEGIRNHSSPQKQQHGAARNDGRTSPYSQTSSAQQAGWSNYQSGFPTGFSYQEPSTPGQEYRSHADDPIDTGDPKIGVVPRYAASLRNQAPTCPLDALILDFLHERRQRTAEGESVHEVIGPKYPSIASLLNPEARAYSHPLSRVFTDILAKFPGISGLPERVAVLYVVFLNIRWQVSPTRENYERLPPWVRPLPCQLYTPHPAWIDHLPFPQMREKLVRTCDQPESHFDNFFFPYTHTLTLSWPYHDTDTLLQSPYSGELMINPVFERHLRNLDNWKLGEAFARALPMLADTCNIATTPGSASTRPAGHSTDSSTSPGAS